jgi:hypothetical protein
VFGAWHDQRHRGGLRCLGVGCLHHVIREALAIVGVVDG